MTPPPARYPLLLTIVIVGLACSCDANAGGECPASGGASDDSVCLCEPFEIAGSVDATAGAPVAQWAVAAGLEGDDSARLIAIGGGEVLIETASTAADTPLLERIAASGERAWQVVLPSRTPHLASTAGGEVMMLFSHDTGQELAVGDRLLTQGDAGSTFLARIDPLTGNFEDLVELPLAGAESTTGIEVDDGGVFQVGSARVVRYDLAGTELWRKDHELASPVTTTHPLGGVLLAGGANGALLMRRLDAQLDEAWEFVHPGFDQPVVTAQAVGTSASGGVAVAFTLEQTDADSGETTREMRLASFDGAANVTFNVALTSAAEGLAFVDDAEIVVWRPTAPGETPGWKLARYAADGSISWQWTLPARDDYAELGRIGDLALSEGFLFVSGAFVGRVDLGAGAQVTSAGCTDHFVARFGF